MTTEKMDALLIAPAVALTFTVTLILGKGLLYVLIAMMERAARSAQIRSRLRVAVQKTDIESTEAPAYKGTRLR